MKHILAVYLLIVTLLAGSFFTASAQGKKVVAMDSNDLYYNVVSYRKHYVEVTYPGERKTGLWEDHERPAGHIVFPETIMHKGKKYEVREISSWTFMGCEDITDVQFQENLNVIGFSAFAQCDGLTTIVVPASVKHIGGCTFMGCRNLSSVTLPTQLKKVNDFMFADCSALHNIDLPANVEYIGRRAFDNSGLVSVTLPATVTLINHNAFSRCKELRRVEVLATRPPITAEDAFSDIAPDAVLYVPQGCRDAYSTAEGWSLFSQIEEM